MTPEPIAYVDQQPISIRDTPDLLAQVGTALARDDGFTLYTLNLDHLVKRRENPAFRLVYARATFVTADGWPVVSLARRVAPSIQRTPGADFVVPLCTLAARDGHSVALFGSCAPVLEAAASRLRALCPGLRIAFSEAPPSGFDPYGAGSDAAIARLKASDARLCFVALGAPKQEIFAARARGMPRRRLRLHRRRVGLHRDGAAARAGPVAAHGSRMGLASGARAAPLRCSLCELSAAVRPAHVAAGTSTLARRFAR